MHSAADLAALCLVPVAIGGCVMVPTLGTSLGVWAATRGVEIYTLRELPTRIFASSRAVVAAAVADVLGSLGVERASVHLGSGEAHVVKAALPIQGEILIALVPLGINVTKVTVTARTGGLGPDVEVGKEILGRIGRALEGRREVASSWRAATAQLP